MQGDLDTLVRLLAAVSVQWLRDAERDPAALADLSEWLGEPEEKLIAAMAERPEIARCERRPSVK